MLKIAMPKTKKKERIKLKLLTMREQLSAQIENAPAQRYALNQWWSFQTKGAYKDYYLLDKKSVERDVYSLVAKATKEANPKRQFSAIKLYESRHLNQSAIGIFHTDQYLILNLKSADLIRETALAATTFELMIGINDSKKQKKGDISRSIYYSTRERDAHFRLFSESRQSVAKEKQSEPSSTTDLNTVDDFLSILAKNGI